MFTNKETEGKGQVPKLRRQSRPETNLGLFTRELIGLSGGEPGLPGVSPNEILDPGSQA